MHESHKNLAASCRVREQMLLRAGAPQSVWSFSGTWPTAAIWAGASRMCAVMCVPIVEIGVQAERLAVFVVKERHSVARSPYVIQQRNDTVFKKT